MSAKVEAKIEIRDMRILKDTLTRMGYKTNERNNGIAIKEGYRDIFFDLDKQKVVHDSYEASTVNNIKAQYAFDFEKNRLAQLGATFDVVETEDRIEILVK